MPKLIPAAPGSPEWLAARRAGVTATDIMTILGLSSYDSPYSLYWRKLGQVPEVPDNDRFRLGRYLEHYAVHRWLEEHPGWMDEPSSLMRSSARAWQLATLDRLVHARGDSPNEFPLEVKSWADADRHSWQDGPPATVRAQVLWQMDVMDVAAGHVGVVFLPSGEFRSYVISHGDGCGPAHTEMLVPDCSICVDLGLMRAAGEEFMARLRLELPAPDPDASAASLAAVRARFARQPDKEAIITSDEWEAFSYACAKVDEWTAKKRAAEITIRESAGEGSLLLLPDETPVLRRVVSDQQVKAHTRHVDYLRRISNGSNDE